jgi:micrococcal nuclease
MKIGQTAKDFSYDKWKASTKGDCEIMRKEIISILIILALLLPSLASAAPNEARGLVTNVVDGDTIDVLDIGRVRLADIDCPEMGTTGGAQAKDYVTQWLQDMQVYLDLDNKTGKDQYDRWVAVVYMANPDGSVDTSKNFNQMLVDSGNACIWDFSDNEFTPADWWDGSIPADKCIKTEQSSPNVGYSSPLPVVQDTSSQSSGSSGASFVGSSKSNKYHYPSCQWAQKISPANEVWFSGSQDARNQGYVPCKVCRPP